MPADPSKSRAAALAVLAAIAGIGCAPPVLSRAGQLVFAQGGARGASVLTANGVEFIDRTDIPAPVVRRSANEPWRPATGFLLPPDGIWRETSKPVAVSGRGLAVILRSSDALIPSWGGEILLRIDAVVPAAAFPHAAPSLRPAKKLVIVVDGHGPNTAPLVRVALDNLGERDRVAIVDSARARTIMPLVPGTHRTLLGAAVERVVGSAERPGAPARDLAAALALARGWLTVRSVGPLGLVRHVLVITDGAGVAEGARSGRIIPELRSLAAAGARVTGVGSADRLSRGDLEALGPDVFAGGLFAEREDAVARAVPPPGDTVLRDVSLVVSSVPAPSRVVELSGGSSVLALEADRIHLGDLYAGEARTEVARVAVPVWVPGEPLELTVTASYTDAATGEPLSASSTIRGRYSNDIERIAKSRHGDVIAYASGLAMVRRLHRAFAGSMVDQVGGLRTMVAWQAQSLGALARATRDPALATQAEILATLLAAID
ncbi:MAG TPA: hypothetical protein VE093_08535 [Polyangiaceae bacterium]|jgi:hypothetical protein|nr:hypothetical protein [Polyangiaceae bacterium]